MKTIYNYIFMLLLLLPFTANAQVVTYTFDLDGNGYTADGGTTYTNMTQYPSVALGGGTFETSTLATLGDTSSIAKNTTTVFHGKTRTNNTASVDLTAFTACTDQQVVWKTYFKTMTSVTKGCGVLLRAQSAASGYSASTRQGYFFMVNGTATTGTVQIRITKLTSSTSVSDVKGNTNVVIPGFTNGPLYVKAKVVGSKLYFEYSLDGTTFTAFTGSPYTDATFPLPGTVQLAWGLGSGSGLDQYYDDVTVTNLDVAKLTINGNNKLIYDGTNDAVTANFDINTAGYKYFTNQTVDQPVITYQYKGIGITSYSQSSTAPSTVGKYIVIGSAVSAAHNQSATDTLAFEILPSTYNKYYTFVDDVTGVAPDSTYNTLNTHLVQSGIGTLLGFSTRSNMLQPSSANAITTLAKFGTTDSISTNYSVVWKCYSSATGQKRGVILRAAGTNAFSRINSNTVNTGQGYMFYVNNTSETATQMDIRKLHSFADSATYKVPTTLATINTIPGSKLNAETWFKATAKDSVLTFEYSLDGTIWHLACTATDSAYSKKTLTYPTRYFSGTTQLSGINSGGTSYYYDYILYSTSTDLLSGVSKVQTSSNPIAYNVNGGIKVLVNSYDIYNIQGINMKSARNSETNKIEFLKPGVYIIKSGVSVQKVLVK
jgi:hypothetical protein